MQTDYSLDYCFQLVMIKIINKREIFEQISKEYIFLVDNRFMFKQVFKLKETAQCKRLKKEHLNGFLSVSNGIYFPKIILAYKCIFRVTLFNPF